jgi:hypothetical protein
MNVHKLTQELSQKTAPIQGAAKKASRSAIERFAVGGEK